MSEAGPTSNCAIHGDTQTDELILTPTYHYIGRFSKFIEPGARRVSTSASRAPSGSTFESLRELVTVVMNRTDNPMTYALVVGERKSTWTFCRTPCRPLCTEKQHCLCTVVQEPCTGSSSHASCFWGCRTHSQTALKFNATDPLSGRYGLSMEHRLNDAFSAGAEVDLLSREIFLEGLSWFISQHTP